MALCREGKGHVRLNGQPLTLVEPSIMRVKVIEPILLLGKDRFAGVDVRMRVKGGGQSAQVYAVRQALAKAVVAYAQKCEWGGRACFCFFVHVGEGYGRELRRNAVSLAVPCGPRLLARRPCDCNLFKV